MFEQGLVVAKIGRYQVVEARKALSSGRLEVVGYLISGPGADSKWTYPTAELAKKRASLLHDDLLAGLIRQQSPL